MGPGTKARFSSGGAGDLSRGAGVMVLRDAGDLPRYGAGDRWRWPEGEKFLAEGDIVLSCAGVMERVTFTGDLPREGTGEFPREETCRSALQARGFEGSPREIDMFRDRVLGAGESARLSE